MQSPSNEKRKEMNKTSNKTTEVLQNRTNGMIDGWAKTRAQGKR